MRRRFRVVPPSLAAVLQRGHISLVKCVELCSHRRQEMANLCLWWTVHDHNSKRRGEVCALTHTIPLTGCLPDWSDL
ncbi:hypothetical protein C0J52_00632 [Blattella germanica]|nr:hypothetical protein C0J52_00632 [Blattella germanica]